MLHASGDQAQDPEAVLSEQQNASWPWQRTICMAPGHCKAYGPWLHVTFSTLIHRMALMNNNRGILDTAPHSHTQIQRDRRSTAGTDV